MYTVEEIKKRRIFEEDDYDEDHKIFAQTILKSKREKKVFTGLLLLGVTIWVLWFRYKAAAYARGEPVELIP